MEIEKMMVSALEEIAKSGLIEKTVKEKIEQTIKSIINDLFRDYSDFGKDLKEKLSEAVKVNLDQIDLPTYNVMVANAIREQTSNIMTDESQKLINERLKNILSIEEKPEQKLSEIIEDFKESLSTNAYEEGWEKMSLHIDDDRSNLIFIRFDKEPGKEQYSCKYNLVIHSDTGKVHSVSFDDYDSTSSEDKIISKLRGFKEKFFRLYSQGVKIEVDDCEDSIYYPDPYD